MTLRVFFFVNLNSITVEVVTCRIAAQDPMLAYQPTPERFDSPSDSAELLRDHSNNHIIRISCGLVSSNNHMSYNIVVQDVMLAYRRARNQGGIAFWFR